MPPIGSRAPKVALGRLLLLGRAVRDVEPFTPCASAYLVNSTAPECPSPASALTQPSQVFGSKSPAMDREAGLIWRIVDRRFVEIEDDRRGRS